MSIIKLGNRVTNVTYKDDYDYYVASVIDSQSGFMEPKLVRTVSQLRSYFGEFEYESMYAELLKRDIPVLLLPKLTGISDLNRCTLRISEVNDGNKSTYKISHPKYGKEYTSSDEFTSSELKDASYNCIIDFRYVDINEFLENASDDTANANIPYIVISKDGDDYDESGNDKDNRIQFQLSRHKDSALYTEATEEPIKLFYDVPEGSTDNTWTEDQVKYLPLFGFEDDPKTYPARSHNEETLFHVFRLELLNHNIESVNIYEELTEVLEYYLSSYDYSDLIQLNTEIQFHPDDLDLIALRDAEYELLVDHTIESIYISEFLNDSPRNIGYVVSEAFSYLDSLNPSVRSRTDYSALASDIMSTIKNQNMYDQLNTYSIALKYKEKVIVPYFTDIDELNISSNSSYDDDIDSIITEDNKLIEFYSKIKGPQGSDTHVDITKGDLDDTYYITITNGDEVESYNVTTVPQMTDSLYYDPTIRYDYITTINQKSNLVFIKFFDFIYEDKYVCQSDLDIDYINSLDETQLYTAFGYTHNEVTGEWEPNPRKLPEVNDLYLSRYVEEYPSHEDELNTLEVLNSSEWYPDLLLVNDLNLGKSNADYINKINEFCNSHKTQALIKVTKDNFIDHETYLINMNLFNLVFPSIPGSRLLTFYDDLTINDYAFPSFYPYILNILNSRFLDIPSEKILYNKLPEKLDRVLIDVVDGTAIYNYSEDKLQVIDTEFLKSYNINYFDYNNIYYNYKRLREPNPDPDFQVIYCTSKISRIFLNGSDYLIGSEPQSFELRLTELIRRSKALLPLVDNIDYKYTFDGNRYDIELSVILTKLVNKIFIFNITLNI